MTQCETFHGYFVSNYGFDGKTSVPKIWNHFDGTHYRTNNVCEGFHSKVNNMLKGKPTLFKFIELIKDLEYQSKTRVAQSLTCEFKVKRSGKDKCNDSNIECIKESLKTLPFDDFFDAMTFQVLNPYDCWTGLGLNVLENESAPEADEPAAVTSDQPNDESDQLHNQQHTQQYSQLQHPTIQPTIISTTIPAPTALPTNLPTTTGSFRPTRKL